MRPHSILASLSLCLLLVGSQASAAAPAYSATFDGGFPPGWTIQNNSSPVGDRTWERGPVSSLAPNPRVAQTFVGVNYESAGVDPEGRPALADNWLIAAPMTFRPGDVVAFSTRAATPPPPPINGVDQYADRLQVWLSLTADGPIAPGNATLLLDLNKHYALGYEAGHYPYDWTAFDLPLSGLAAEAVGRIGFRYLVEDSGPTGSRGDEIWLDDFAVARATPEPSTLGLCLGIIGAVAMRRRRGRR